jgi:hypothetical protein
MPDPTFTAGVAGAIGAVIGSITAGTASIFTMKSQNRHQIEMLEEQFKRQVETINLQQQKEVARLREQQVHDRALVAASSCHQYFGTLGEAVPQFIEAQNSRRTTEKEKLSARDRVSGWLSELLTESAFLPTEVRRPVMELHDFLQQAHYLGSDSIYNCGHWQGATTIAKHAAHYGQEIAASFVRGEPLPDEPDLITEYRLTYADLMDEKEHEFGLEIQEDSNDRALWRERRQLSSE